jgi:hypothetical protein
MALVVVMLAFAALFYFDLNKVLHIKGMTKNGGDAAALAGARWQAISLNLIGSLNVAQAAALTDALSQGQTSTPEMETISALQQRIAFSGPIYGVMAAQQAGKKNGLHNRPEYADSVSDHVNIVRDEYGLLYPQPFPPSGDFATAWEEVADMYSLIAEHGMAVQPAWQYYLTYSHYNHLLLNPSFYDAIAGQSWCWFYQNAYSELQSYEDWTDWEALPPLDPAPPVNAEVLSLHLQRVRVRDTVPVLPPGTDWENLMSDLQNVLTQLETDTPDTYGEVNVLWSGYRPSRWSSWTSIIPENFPWDRDVRPEYNYGGADSAMAVIAESPRHSDPEFLQNEDLATVFQVEWSAVAKPFGTLEGFGGEARPTTAGVVLPAYTDIRLIPIDTSMSGGNDQLRPGWIEFITNILPDYMVGGPSVLPMDNWYARQLVTWETDIFRLTAINWLLTNSASCEQSSPGPGSGGSSGGTRFGR